MVLHPLGREREGLGTTLSPGTGMGGKRARSRPTGRCSGGGQGRTLLGIPAGGLRVLPSSPRSRSRFRRGLGQPSPEPARRAAGAIGRAPLLPPGAPRGQPTLTGQVGTGEPPGGTEPLRLLGSLRDAPIALPCAPHCAESRYPGSCPLLSQRGRRAWKLKHKGLNRKQEKELRRSEPAG